MELLFLGQVDQVVVINALDRLVGRDDHHVQAIDLTELEGFSIGGPGHAGELVVEAEIVLEGGGGQGLALGLDPHPFLGLDGLVQPLAPAATGHGTAGVLIHDDDLTTLNNVVHVLLEQVMGPECRMDVVQQAQIGCRVEAVALLEQPLLQQQLLDLLVPHLGQLHLPGLLVDDEITGGLAVFPSFPLVQFGDQRIDRLIELGAVLSRA